ncbi:hypothetical protein M5689_024087 [Euphorbia peplus]|nr:hypothetical protein M5689_024087 [Euphorbia peplus]
MDFHSLKRKRLQSLCKKHGIPANKTNIQMADLLTAALMEKKDNGVVKSDDGVVNRNTRSKARSKITITVVEGKDEIKNPSKGIARPSSKRTSVAVPLECGQLVPKESTKRQKVMNLDVVNEDKASSETIKQDEMKCANLVNKEETLRVRERSKVGTENTVLDSRNLILDCSIQGGADDHSRSSKKCTNLENVEENLKVAADFAVIYDHSVLDTSKDGIVNSVKDDQCRSSEECPNSHNNSSAKLNSEEFQAKEWDVLTSGGENSNFTDKMLAEKETSICKDAYCVSDDIIGHSAKGDSCCDESETVELNSSFQVGESVVEKLAVDSLKLTSMDAWKLPENAITDMSSSTRVTEEPKNLVRYACNASELIFSNYSAELKDGKGIFQFVRDEKDLNRDQHDFASDGALTSPLTMSTFIRDNDEHLPEFDGKLEEDGIIIRGDDERVQISNEVGNDRTDSLCFGSDATDNDKVANEQLNLPYAISEGVSVDDDIQASEDKETAVLRRNASDSSELNGSNFRAELLDGKGIFQFVQEEKDMNSGQRGFARGEALTFPHTTCTSIKDNNEHQQDQETTRFCPNGEETDVSERTQADTLPQFFMEELEDENVFSNPVIKNSCEVGDSNLGEIILTEATEISSCVDTHCGRPEMELHHSSQLDGEASNEEFDGQMEGENLIRSDGMVVANNPADYPSLGNEAKGHDEVGNEQLNVLSDAFSGVLIDVDGALNELFCENKTEIQPAEAGREQCLPELGDGPERNEHNESTDEVPLEVETPNRKDSFQADCKTFFHFKKDNIQASEDRETAALRRNGPDASELTESSFKVKLEDGKGIFQFVHEEKNVNSGQHDSASGEAITFPHTTCTSIEDNDEHQQDKETMSFCLDGEETGISERTQVDTVPQFIMDELEDENVLSNPVIKKSCEVGYSNVSEMILSEAIEISSRADSHCGRPEMKLRHSLQLDGEASYEEFDGQMKDSIIRSDGMVQKFDEAANNPTDNLNLGNEAKDHDEVVGNKQLNVHSDVFSEGVLIDEDGVLNELSCENKTESQAVEAGREQCLPELGDEVVTVAKSEETADTKNLDSVSPLKVETRDAVAGSSSHESEDFELNLLFEGECTVKKQGLEASPVNLVNMDAGSFIENASFTVISEEASNLERWYSANTFTASAVHQEEFDGQMEDKTKITGNDGRLQISEAVANSPTNNTSLGFVAGDHNDVANKQLTAHLDVFCEGVSVDDSGLPNERSCEYKTDIQSIEAAKEQCLPEQMADTKNADAFSPFKHESEDAFELNFFFEEGEYAVEKQDVEASPGNLVSVEAGSFLENASSTLIAEESSNLERGYTANSIVEELEKVSEEFEEVERSEAMVVDQSHLFAASVDHQANSIVEVLQKVRVQFEETDKTERMMVDQSHPFTASADHQEVTANSIVEEMEKVPEEYEEMEKTEATMVDQSYLYAASTDHQANSIGEELQNVREQFEEMEKTEAMKVDQSHLSASLDHQEVTAEDGKSGELELLPTETSADLENDKHCESLSFPLMKRTSISGLIPVPDTPQKVVGAYAMKENAASVKTEQLAIFTASRVYQKRRPLEDLRNQ